MVWFLVEEYNYRKQNYERSLFEGIIPTGLNGMKRWNAVLFNTEKRLVKILLEESEKVIETVQTDITREMDKKVSDYKDSERI